MRFTDCTKSTDILALHIARIPYDTNKKTIALINLTRSAVKGKKWEPDEYCFI